MNEEASIETTSSVAKDNKEIVHSHSHIEAFWAKVERGALFASILASIATVVGIFLVADQITQSNTIEKRRFAVDAIRQTRSAEFMKALRQIKIAYETKRVDEKDKDSLIDSINHVMNVYDDIAVVYINDIADRCIIKDAIESGAREVAHMRDALASSPAEDKHLNLFLNLMSHESCEGRDLSQPK